MSIKRQFGMKIGQEMKDISLRGNARLYELGIVSVAMHDNPREILMLGLILH